MDMKAFAVYGPPGCGKTTEMLRRVEQAKGKYKTSEICFLSFTKAGAAEALKRLGITKSDKISTIHSMAYRLCGIVKESVVDPPKLKKFSDRTGFRFKGQSNDTSEQMELGDMYMSILAKATNKRSVLKDEYYHSERPGDWAGFEFFCRAYRDGYIDFDDMLRKYLILPSPHGARIIFVDEAQDLSALQWAVIEKMIEIGSVDEVHIAGDDDQAIYEWSGASAHGMEEFERRHAAERTILNQSWRVPISVHEIAVRLANTIENRVPKVYLPRSERGVVRRISRFDPKSVVHGEDILILCRNYVSRKSIEDELIRHRIPYRNEGGYPSLFSTRVADAIRIFNRLKAGGDVSQPEIDKMIFVANDRTKAELSTRNLGPMLERGVTRSFVIPNFQVDFYREADLDAEPTIRLSTIHSAKGREADRVILHTGLTLKTIRDMDVNGDAEARVWYVGVTRARQTLEILEDLNGYNIR